MRVFINNFGDLLSIVLGDATIRFANAGLDNKDKLKDIYKGIFIGKLFVVDESKVFLINKLR